MYAHVCVHVYVYTSLTILQILQTHMSLVQWMAKALLRLSRAKHVSQGGPHTQRSSVD